MGFLAFGIDNDSNRINLLADFGPSSKLDFSLPESLAKRVAQANVYATLSMRAQIQGIALLRVSFQRRYVCETGLPYYFRRLVW